MRIRDKFRELNVQFKSTGTQIRTRDRFDNRQWNLLLFLFPFQPSFHVISCGKYFCCSQVLLTENFGRLLIKLKSWHHHFLLTPRHCIYGVIVYEVSTSGMLSLTYFYIFFKFTESFCYSHFMNASLISLYTLSILKFKVS